MSESIFAKIIKGEVPAHKIYEDATTLAFLDIHPVQPGHTLVIPKRQEEFVWDLTDAEYQAVMATVLKVARQLREVLGCRYVGERIIGLDVPHAHVQLIPFNTIEEWRRQQDMSVTADDEALAALAARIRFA